MERKTSRNLYLGGIVLAIIATILIVVASVIAAANATTGPDGQSQVPDSITTVLAILTIAAAAIYVIGAILAIVAWIGALIKTARLGEWVWFILLLILGGTGIMMLVYIFAGPTQPKMVTASTPGM